MEITKRVISGEWREEWGKSTEYKHNRQAQSRGRLRIIWEMEKPKNLYLQPMDMNEAAGKAGWWVQGGR